MLLTALTALTALLPLIAAAPTPSPALAQRSTGQLIISSWDGLCLAVGESPDAAPYNGAPVHSVPCYYGSLWDIDRGSGSIILSGTDYALDAGSNPGNNGAVKVSLLFMDLDLELD